MSVQASETHYCTPRIDYADIYTEVEVGFPSEREELVMPHIEVPGGVPTKNVYPWVPSQVVADVIKKHGGLIGGELPPMEK